MANFDKQHDPVRLFMRRIGTALLFIVVIALFAGDWSTYKKERGSRDLRTQAEVQYANLAEQEAQLDSQITKLKTARGKEEAMREQFEVGKSGEGLIVIVDQPVAEPTEATSTLRRIIHKFLPFW